MTAFAVRSRSNLRDLGGDFVVWKSADTPAYQLAVVVDDAAQGVTEVIRGDDLVPSTPRQLVLYCALGLTPPKFAHVPLVVGPDGRRLAKRHGDTRLSALRADGVTAVALLGLLAWSCGWLELEIEPIAAGRFARPLYPGEHPSATVRADATSARTNRLSVNVSPKWRFSRRGESTLAIGKSCVTLEDNPNASDEPLQGEFARATLFATGVSCVSGRPHADSRRREDQAKARMSPTAPAMMSPSWMLRPTR